MLDKKRLALIIAIAAVVIAAVIIAIVLVTTANQPAAKPTPTPSATSTPSTTAPGFTNELRSLTITAAASAAQFQGSDTRAARERYYLKAGFSPELARNFEPVWFDVFSNATKTKIAATGETLIGAAINVKGSALITEVTATGEAGHRVYRAAVEVDCQPQWSTDAGGPFTRSPFKATWHVTVDEATGLVTEVTQPKPDEIPFSTEG